jgi:hypothetical protein
MKRILALFALFPLAACSGVPGLSRDQEPALVIGAVTAGGPLSVAADPTASAASEPQSAGRFLGFSVTSLGDASLPGLWLETPLVRTEMTGRVVAENGRQIDLVLRPSGGARGSGSRMSLAGFTALGIPLTALSTLTVIGDV